MTRSTSEIEELIDSTVTIPTVPGILTEITRIINNPEGTPEEAANVVAKDPSIATKVLRLVNSSLYSLSFEVIDIKHAVSILGLRILRNLVVQATILDHFHKAKGKRGGFDPIWLWNHSVLTGAAARILVTEAQAKTGLDGEEAYTAGLLHDLGKIILLQNQGPRFLKAAEFSLAKGIPLHMVEKKAYGFTHADVGSLLAERWKLNEVLYQAIHDHHRPLEIGDQPELSCLLNCANGIAHLAADRPGGYRGHPVQDEVLEVLGLTREGIKDFIAEVKETELIRG